MQKNYLRFSKLELCNYGIFKGRHEISFERSITLFNASNGTGKTALVNALKHLGPAPGVKPHHSSCSGEMSVKVTTVGDTRLVEKYHDLIFMEPFTEDDLLIWNSKVLDISLDKALKIIKQTGVFFRQLKNGRSSDFSLFKLETGPLSVSAIHMLMYSNILAQRKVLELDLPLVMRSPFSFLGSVTGRNLWELIQSEATQIILFSNDPLH